MNQSEPIIVVDNLCKSYKISHKLQRNDHPTLKDQLMISLRKPLALIGAKGGMGKEDFYALDQVSFSVQPGEVVGIMGRNGSGKSTLFKLLSRITQPTAGQAELRGRTASLLEVGTGFHPELTGRENIYFNGSILGMTKKEITAKFDDIVHFSEVDKFLDTPIKFYSSGMKVRLAFSVAAHLEPEILIIDEVLSVGDVKFKQKSLERMKQIAKSGTTVLFVSHIISQIEKICTRGIVLDNGKLAYDGALEEAIVKYLEFNQLDDEGEKLARQNNTKLRPDITSPGINTSLNINLEQKKDKPAKLSATIELDNKSEQDLSEVSISLMVADERNKNLIRFNNSDSKQLIKNLAAGETGQFRFTCDPLLLAPGTYKLTLGVVHKGSNEPLVREEEAATFTVKPYHVFGRTVSSRPNVSIPPVVLDYTFEEA